MVVAIEPSPEAVNAAVMLPDASLEITTSSVMLLKVWPGAREMVVVQVTVLKSQTHSEPPPIDPGVSAEASVATIVIVPLVASFPVLETVIV